MSYTVELEEDTQSCTVKLSGKLNVYNVKEFRDMILPITERVPTINFDLKEVTEIDSSFLQLFISLKNSAYQLGHILKITSHSKSVLHIIDVFGLVGFFADKIVLNSKDRKEFSFSYGTARVPKTLR
jgi:anti-sigma B factor antagonist